MPDRRRQRLRIMIVGGVVMGALLVVAWLVLVPSTERYRMPSASMAPGIKEGETFTINKDAYGGDLPHHSDIVAFHPPSGASEQRCGVAHPDTQMCPRATAGLDDSIQVKRVVALPGDAISMEGGGLFNDGVRIFEYKSYKVGLCPRANDGCSFPTPVTVPPGTVLVIGDNRGESSDSRYWGPVPVDAIVGRVDDCLLGPLGCHARHGIEYKNGEVR